MNEWGSTAVEGSVGAVVVCFLLSCITRAGRDFVPARKDRETGEVGQWGITVSRGHAAQPPPARPTPLPAV